MTERATRESTAQLGEVLTKAGLIVPASAVEKRRVILGGRLIASLRDAIRRGAKQKVGLVLICQDGCDSEAAICRHARVMDEHVDGRVLRTEYECGCTVRVIPGGL